jgi:alkaline phosphatase D
VTPISRRTFLCLAAAAGAACSSDDDTATTTASTAAPTASDPPASTEPVSTEPVIAEPATTSATSTTEASSLTTDPFTFGVASGDPDSNSIVLWTRLAGDLGDDDIVVRWETSDSADFATIVSSGQAAAEARHGHSVHAIADGPPGRWFYRFSVGDFNSPVGTAVLSAPDQDSLRFVSASCQNYEDGYYHAHADIAAMQPDFVVFLGDYMYEGAGAVVDPTTGTVRSHGSTEPTTLDEYRDRYALYRSDPNLQAAHAACPWLVIWDDHEVENNYAGLVPQNADDAAGFAARRAGAYQAWWEHMPVRLPPPSGRPGDDVAIYRQAQWGSLLGLTLLDGRQYRSDQTCGDVALTFDPACPETFDESRTMLGAAQEQFFADGFGRQGTTWNVVGQQTVLLDFGLTPAILNYDQWDGYPAARSRLTSTMVGNAVTNAIVLTGDIHAAGVGVVRDGAAGVGQQVAVEFVATSLSSSNNVDPSLTDAFTAFADVLDADLAHRGYILHTVTAEEWIAEFRIVDDPLAEQSSMSVWKTFRVGRDSGEVTTLE